MANGEIGEKLGISISSARRFMELPYPSAVKKPKPKPTPYRKPVSVSDENGASTHESPPEFTDPCPSEASGTLLTTPADERLFEDDVNEKTFRQILCRVQEIPIPRELIDVRVRSGGFISFAKRIRMRMAKERIELSYDSARKYTLQFMADLGVKPRA